MFTSLSNLFRDKNCHHRLMKKNLPQRLKESNYKAFIIQISMCRTFASLLSRSWKRKVSQHLLNTVHQIVDDQFIMTFCMYYSTVLEKKIFKKKQRGMLFLRIVRQFNNLHQNKCRDEKELEKWRERKRLRQKH